MVPLTITSVVLSLHSLGKISPTTLPFTEALLLILNSPVNHAAAIRGYQRIIQIQQSASSIPAEETLASAPTKNISRDDLHFNAYSTPAVPKQKRKKRPRPSHGFIISSSSASEDENDISPIPLVRLVNVQDKIPSPSPNHLSAFFKPRARRGARDETALTNNVMHNVEGTTSPRLKKKKLRFSEENEILPTLDDYAVPDTENENEEVSPIKKQKTKTTHRNKKPDSNDNDEEDIPPAKTIKRKFSLTHSHEEVDEKNDKEKSTKKPKRKGLVVNEIARGHSIVRGNGWMEGKADFLAPVVLVKKKKKKKVKREEKGEVKNPFMDVDWGLLVEGQGEERRRGKKDGRKKRDGEE